MAFPDSRPYDLIRDIESYFVKFPDSVSEEERKREIATWASGTLLGYHAAADVFWSTWWAGSNRPSAYHTEVLRFLDKLHSNNSEPEEDLFRDSYVMFQLENIIHIAAAHVIYLKRRDGLTEEVVDGAREVIHFIDRLRSVMDWEACPDLTNLDEEFFDTALDTASVLAVGALMKLELSRDSYLQGEYAESLAFLASAADYFVAAAGEANADLPLGVIEVAFENLDELGFDPREWGDYDPGMDEEIQAGEDLRQRLAEHLDGLPFSLDEANELWQQVMANERSVSDWGVVVDCCRQLMETPSQTEETDRVSDKEGNEVNWRELWLAAKTEADGQLRPDRLSQQYEKWMANISEERIKMYVFGDRWKNVNRDCRAALISADERMNSKQQRGRFPGILNELKRAAEAMCYQFIWVPQMERDSTSALPEFDRLQRRLRNKSPSLVNFSQILKAKYFKTILREQKFSPCEVDFLTRILPKEMQYLGKLRNEAEHEFSNRQWRSEVRASYYRWLGCGRLGLLPELAHIGPKVAELWNR